jgi:prevent-host-death family protein
VKTVSIRDLQRTIGRCVRIAQKENVVVTRHGRPAAIVIGVEGQDWEDLLYRSSPSFWRMIEARRKERTSPWAEARKRIEARWAKR